MLWVWSDQESREEVVEVRVSSLTWLRYRLRARDVAPTNNQRSIILTPIPRASEPMIWYRSYMG